ncbi:MAG: ferrochelatase [Deltaproteobacteria bacterium]|nr:ferrochelatase [Deltaproteobacteria bacterium]
MTGRIGVLLLNLGGPAGPDEVRPFIRDLLSEPAVLGLPWPLRPALASFIASLRFRKVITHYDAIGGASPIGECTAAQAEGVAARLGPGFVVRHAFRFSAPRIPQIVEALAAQGVRRLVALPLFPQASRSTTGVVLAALEKAVMGRMEIAACGSHAGADGYIEALADGILSRLGDAQHVIVSAHGLPAKLASRDTYLPDVKRTFAALEKRLAGRAPLSLAFQSRLGRGKWTEPYLTDEIARLASTGSRRLLVAPVSFACENLETLYELDIELPLLVRSLGALSIARAPVPGTHPAYLAALAGLVRRALEDAGEARHAV